MLNRQIATHNLALLYRIPDLTNIGIDPDGLHLNQHPISSDQQESLRAIINNTFAFAEQQEALGHRLWIEVSVSDRQSLSCSAGHILSHLRPPFTLEQRALTTVVEEHSQVKINCQRAFILADLEILTHSSVFFANVFDSRLMKEKRFECAIDCSPLILQEIIHFFHGGPLPPIDDRITDRCLLAAYLFSERLDLALAQQLVKANHLDDESWRILFKIHPTIFDPILMRKTLEETQNILAILLRPPMDTSLKGLLIRLLNAKKIPFLTLCSLIGGFENFQTFFSPEHLKKIKVLDLSRFVFKEINSIISVIQQCTNLIELVLPQKLGSFLDYLEGTPFLEHLHISYSGQLDPFCLNNLKFVPLLKYLRISGEMIDPSGLENLKYVPLLEHLDLYNCTSLDPFCLNNLKFVPLLKYLNLQECLQLHKNSLQYLVYTPLLEHLNIALTELGLEGLEYLPSLKRLELSGCKLAKDSLKYLRYTPQLTYLDITQTDLDSLAELSYVPRLLILKIINCNKLAPDSLSHLMHVPLLHHLDAGRCTSLDSHSLVFLWHVQRLQFLCIANCRQLAATCLSHLKYVRGLLNLDISHCDQLEPRALKNLEHTPMLEQLKFFSCRSLQRDCFKHFQYTPHLRTLHIDPYRRLEKHALGHLKYLRKLQVLSMDRCHYLHPNCLEHLRHTPDLKELMIFGCDTFNKDSLRHLIHVPKLEKLLICDSPQLNRAHIPSSVKGSWVK